MDRPSPPGQPSSTTSAAIPASNPLRAGILALIVLSAYAAAPIYQRDSVPSAMNNDVAEEALPMRGQVHFCSVSSLWPRREDDVLSAAQHRLIAGEQRAHDGAGEADSRRGLQRLVGCPIHLNYSVLPPRD